MNPDQDSIVQEIEQTEGSVVKVICLLVAQRRTLSEPLSQEEKMFALYATSHNGMTQTDISSLPAMPGRGHLLQWLETGGQCRLANSEYLGDLRELRRQLAALGLKTEIHEARELTPPPIQPVTYDDCPAAMPATDSGVHQYRQMMAEIDGNRSTREHKAAVAFKVGPMQVTFLAAIAVLGTAVAFAI